MKGQMNETTTQVKWVLRKQIAADPDQPRKEFNAEKLKELAESLKAVGQQIPLLVRELTEGKNGAKYQIIFGERRWRAAELAGVERLKVEVADTSAPDWNKRKLALQVLENQCRENLTALEEAAALARECKEDKAEEVAKRHGMSRASLFGKLRLLELCEAAKKALLAGEITASVAGLIATVPADKQAQALNEVNGDGDWSGPMPFRRAQERIESQFAKQLKNATFDLKTQYALTKEMVSGPDGKVAAMCEGCRYRSGNMEGSGLKNPNVCTQPPCFAAKAKQQGQTVMKGKEGAKLFSEYGDEDVNHSSGFVELDKRADLLGWEYKNHYRAALGKDAEGLAITVAVDRHGVARQLAKRSEVEAVLKKAGKLKKAAASDKSDRSEIEQKKRDKAKRERMKRMDYAVAKAVPIILEKLTPNGVVAEKAWQRLAWAAYEQTNIDVHAQVADRRGLTAKQTDCRKQLENWLRQKHTPAEFAQFMIEVLTCGRPYPLASWMKLKWEEGFKGAAEFAGVNLEKLEKEAGKTKPHAKGKGKK
jgi:ParB/RepB/Spo0J family partition protein